MKARSLQSRTVRHAPHEWHILEGGQGATVLFLHGAGANCESFGSVMSALADRFRVVAPDLPGHGSTRLGAKGRSGLIAMADDIAALVPDIIGLPLLIVGHSAGAAVALELCKHVSPRGLVLINPALDPFGGAAGWAFPAMARGLSIAPFAGEALAGLFGRRLRIRELLKATGSDATEEMEARYLALARNAIHIRGTLAMMAAWDVSDLRKTLPDHSLPTTVIIGDQDRTIVPEASLKSAQRMPNARIHTVQGGHLVHEETPKLVAQIIDEAIEALAMESD